MKVSFCVKTGLRHSSTEIEIDPYVAGVNSVPDWMLSHLGIENAMIS